MPRSCLWRYLPQHLLFNLIAILYFAARGQARTVVRAKWHALRALPRMIRKRRVVQAGKRVADERIRALLAKGWLAPYRRGHR
jgi:hypothetical protein